MYLLYFTSLGDNHKNDDDQEYDEISWDNDTPVDE